MNLQTEEENDDNEKKHKKKIHLETTEIGLCLIILCVGISMGIYLGIKCKYEN